MQKLSFSFLVLLEYFTSMIFRFGVVHKWRHAILRKNLPFSPPSSVVTFSHFPGHLQIWRHKRLYLPPAACSVEYRDEFQHI